MMIIDINIGGGYIYLDKKFMIIWINCQRQSGVPTWPRPWRGGVDGKVSISVFPGANDCVCCDYHSWLWKIAIHFWILDDLTLSRQRTWSWRENKWQFYRLLRREHGGHSLPQVDQYTNQCDFKSLKEFGMSKCDLIRMSEPGGVSPRGYYHRSALLLQVRFSKAKNNFPVADCAQKCNTG